MFIKRCSGYELEKEKSNTSEDFFTRSQIVYEEDGEENSLQVLYVKFFEDLISKQHPFEEDGILKLGSSTVHIRDIVALACYLKKPEFRHRKRVYINTEIEFVGLFKELNFTKIKEIFEALEQSKEFEIQSPLDYIVHQAEAIS